MRHGWGLVAGWATRVSIDDERDVVGRVALRAHGRNRQFGFCRGGRSSSVAAALSLEKSHVSVLRRRRGLIPVRGDRHPTKIVSGSGCSHPLAPMLIKRHSDHRGR